MKIFLQRSYYCVLMKKCQVSSVFAYPACISILLLTDHRDWESGTENDTCTHLLGSTRLLDLASSFAPLGGLGEAASWLLLRQDMFVSLTRSLCPTSTYENYRTSAFFTSSTPEAMANRAVFLCSQVLAYAFRNDTRLDVDRWQELNTSVAEWFDSAPKESLPYFASLPSDDPQTEGSCFPICWMTRPQYGNARHKLPAQMTILLTNFSMWQVLAYQHYYLARLLLSAFDPQLWKPGPDALRKRPEADVCCQSSPALLNTNTQ